MRDEFPDFCKFFWYMQFSLVYFRFRNPSGKRRSRRQPVHGAHDAATDGREVHR